MPKEKMLSVIKENLELGFDNAMCDILTESGCKSGDIEPFMHLYLDELITSASEKLLEIAEYLVEFNK